MYIFIRKHIQNKTLQHTFTANNEQKENNNHQKTSINKVLTATNGLQMNSSKVFIQVFKYIHNNCLQWLYHKGLRYNDNEIEWIITVPAIWNDEAKNCMKEWAKLAGFKHIRIVYESDCASLAMQYQLNTKEKPCYDYNPPPPITPAPNQGILEQILWIQGRSLALLSKTAMLVFPLK